MSVSFGSLLLKSAGIDDMENFHHKHILKRSRELPRQKPAINLLARNKYLLAKINEHAETQDRIDNSFPPALLYDLAAHGEKKYYRDRQEADYIDRERRLFIIYNNEREYNASTGKINMEMTQYKNAYIPEDSLRTQSSRLNRTSARYKDLPTRASFEMKFGKVFAD